MQIMAQYVLPDLFLGAYGMEYLIDMPMALQRELFEVGYAFERQVYQRLPIAPDQYFVVKSPRYAHESIFEAFRRVFEDFRMIIMVRDVATDGLEFLSPVGSCCQVFSKRWILVALAP